MTEQERDMIISALKEAKVLFKHPEYCDDLVKDLLEALPIDNSVSIQAVKEYCCKQPELAPCVEGCGLYAEPQCLVGMPISLWDIEAITKAVEDK